MKLIFIGDVVGKGGRRAVKAMLPELRRRHNASFCVVNGENAANGAGLTAKCANDLLEAADVVTTGDHVWDQKGFDKEITQFKAVLRPANFSASQPGRGMGIFRNPGGGELAVINLQGKVFMRETANCPFETAERLLSELPAYIKTVVVDFHTEATSEIIGMGRFLDGRVTAVLGTHTHVQTADATVLPGGTAFISDVGMVGGVDSVLGRETAAVVGKFRSGMPGRLPVVENNIRLDGVVVEYGLETGRAVGIKAFSELYNPQHHGG